MKKTIIFCAVFIILMLSQVALNNYMLNQELIRLLVVAPIYALIYYLYFKIAIYYLRKIDKTL